MSAPTLHHVFAAAMLLATSVLLPAGAWAAELVVHDALAPARAADVSGPGFAVRLPVESDTARPTEAWIRFCEHYPSECTVDATEPAIIQLTFEAWQTIVSVNRHVNSAIRAQSDQDHWATVDRWDFAEDGYGDCEDYQLVKRRKLIEAGYPRRALRMVVVIDELGEGHAVMMVRTDRGDYILDNKNDQVLPWSQTGYTYVKREGDHGMAWTSLGGVVTAPAVTAGR